MDKQDKLGKKIDELAEVTAFIKDRVVGIEERVISTEKNVQRLDVKIDGVEERLTQKIHSLSNRMDYELDKRKSLEVQMRKVSDKVFGKR